MNSDDQREDPREVGKRRAVTKRDKGRVKLKTLPPIVPLLEPRLKPAPYKKPKWD